MFIDRRARHLAMYLVYRCIHAQDDNALPAADLRRAWRATGLRQDDLEPAVQEMMRLGYLVALQSPSAPNYCLTAAGIREFHLSTVAMAYTAEKWVATLRNWLRPPAPRPAHERRAGQN